MIRKPKAKYTYCWLVWVGATLGIEAIGVYRNRKFGCHDSLTAHTRDFLGIDPKRKRHFLGRGVFAAACAWAAYHIIAPARNPRDL